MYNQIVGSETGTGIGTTSGCSLGSPDGTFFGRLEGCNNPEAIWRELLVVVREEQKDLLIQQRLIDRNLIGIYS